MRWILAALLLLAGQAHADETFLDSDNVGTTPVTIKGSTISVSGISGVVSVAVTSGSIVATSEIGAVTAGISVSGGSGFALFSATGTLRQCGIVPPSAAAVYDFEILTEDAVGYPVLGKNRLRGTTSLAGLRIILGAHRIKFENATPDGSYNVRCVFKE